MTTYKWLVTFFTLFSSLTGFAFEAEHILWDKIPIPLTLSVAEERLIHFPEAIRLIDSEAGDKMTILKVQDSLYLKAKQSFDNQRLLVQLMPQGEVIILNLSAQENKTVNKPIDILVNKDKETENDFQQTANPFDFNAITLTRFAIQSLYAPQRLVTMPAEITRTPMQTRRQINLIFGASIEARPLISWRGGDLYVTAVELTNLLNKTVIIDPRHLIGNWQTATFYPTNTLAARVKKESTTVFLISDRSFNDALSASREFTR